MKTDLLYVRGYVSKGRMKSLPAKTYYYYRRNGKQTRIYGDFMSPDFLDSYNAIHQSHERPDRKIIPGTFRAVAQKCFDSPRWGGKRPLGEGTKKDYQKAVERMLEICGDEPIKKITTRYISDYHESLADTPPTADNALKALTKVFKFAVNKGYVPTNPVTRDIEKFGSGEWVPWEEDQMKVFEENGTGAAMTGYMLALYTGQRQADVLRMTRPNFYLGKKAGLEVTQHKRVRGRTVKLWIPIHPVLRSFLEGYDKYGLEDHYERNPLYLKTGNKTPRRKQKAEGLTMVRRLDGLPYTGDGFRSIWYSQMEPIGLTGLEPNLTFHGLRKNATGALMEAGCTEEQARSITGHRTTQMINKYAIGVRQDRLAKQVQNIWETQK